MRQAKSTRVLTPVEGERIRALRQQVEAEKDTIVAEGRRHKVAHDWANNALRSAFELLKAERQSQGLSLSEMEDRTGIGRATLSRLENDAACNPTVTTLTRYADALGKKLVVGFQ